MITRRGFFGAVAALVVGGGAAQLRLKPEPPERLTFRGVPIYWDDETTYVFTERGAYRLERRRDDGDTILELR